MKQACLGFKINKRSSQNGNSRVTHAPQNRDGKLNPQLRLVFIVVSEQQEGERRGTLRRFFFNFKEGVYPLPAALLSPPHRVRDVKQAGLPTVPVLPGGHPFLTMNSASNKPQYHQQCSTKIKDHDGNSRS